MMVTIAVKILLMLMFFFFYMMMLLMFLLEDWDEEGEEGVNGGKGDSDGSVIW